jgi:hypothetical protein
MTMFFGVLLARQLGLIPHADGVVMPLLATQILWSTSSPTAPPPWRSASIPPIPTS